MILSCYLPSNTMSLNSPDMQDAEINPHQRMRRPCPRKEKRRARDHPFNIKKHVENAIQVCKSVEAAVPPSMTRFGACTRPIMKS